MKASKALKHLFVPHEHNDYKPHFFREISVAILVSVVMFLLGMSAGSSFFVHRTVLGATISTSVLIDLTNESRTAHNEAPLVRNELLDEAAELKAHDMVQERYFAHTSPKGVTPWHWFQKVGYSFLYAGENLAVNFTDPVAVHDAWLASPKHRENLLDVRFKEIGMATAEGLYEGNDSMYVVQMFGTPAPSNPSEERQIASSQTSTEEPVGVNKANQKIKGESAVSIPLVPIYSSWYERLLFSGPYYIQILYIVLFIIVLSALIFMVTIEIQKQHWKHIAYGLSVLCIIMLSALINHLFL